MRELISNSSDALDKFRYQSLTNQKLIEDDSKLEILIEPDLKKRQLIIRDYGIGMTKDELVNNLGTIAKSGTKAFMEAVKAGSDTNQIGQFGVGFYSAFLVADTVEVHSKSYTDSKQHVWKSNAGGSFTVEEDTSEDLGRGTKLVLNIKDDMIDYLKEDKLRKLVRKHSDFIDFLIKLRVTREEEEEVTDDEDDEEVTETTPDTTAETTPDTTTETTPDTTAETTPDTTTETTPDTTAETTPDTTTETTPQTTTDGVTVEDIEENQETSEPTKKTKKIKKTVLDWEPLNYQKPLWCRKPDEVTHQEYASFYKAIANDYEEHLDVKHFSVEGQIEFKALLYIPKRAPFDLYDKGMKKMDNIKLYVRRVFIMDKIDELFPQYLCFIKGVVDSEDLPLNVSREILQQNKITKVMRKHLIKKSLDMIMKIAEDPEKYKVFYENFSKNIKLGIHEDTNNKDKLAKLLRFNSKNSSEAISFQQYVDQMPESQKAIYYISGESLQAIQNAPFMEKIESKGYNVMYMVEPMDEYCMNQLKHFNEIPIVCVTKEGLALEETEDDKKQFGERVKELEPLTNKLKEVLEKDVEKVTVSNRLVTSPCVLVTGTYGWTANMERLVKAQALTDHSTQIQSQFMATKKTMEINPSHPIIEKLNTLSKDETQSHRFKEVTMLMFDTALISSGFSLRDPSYYARHINKLIAYGLSINDIEEWEENQKPQLQSNESETQADENTSDPEENNVEEETMEEVD